MIQQALHADGEERRPSEQQAAASEGTTLPAQHASDGTTLPAQHVETPGEVPAHSIPEVTAETVSLNLHVTDSAVPEATLADSAPDHAVVAPDHGADFPQHAGQAIGESVSASEALAPKEEPQQQLHAATPPAISEVIQMALGDYSKEDVDKR